MIPENKKLKCSLVELSYPSPLEEIKQSRKNLKGLGFSIIKEYISKGNYFERWSGNPDERLNRFYEAWNSDSDMIITVKGGSGISHFFQKIKRNKLKKKKLFCGYSDVTLVLLYIVQKLRIISLHGPNASKELDSKSKKFLKKAIKMENYKIPFKRENILKNPEKEIIGKTIGGNLDRVVEYLIHNKINFDNTILFLEEVHETDFKIFNNLMHLKNYRKFSPEAIIFGGMGEIDNQKMKRMVKEIFPNTPLLYGLPFGHQTPNITIPLGTTCKINFQKKEIQFKFSKRHRRYALKLKS